VARLHKFIKRYTSISATIDMLRRKELALLDPQNWDDRNDRYFMSLYKDHVKASGLYAACFTQSMDTYHHWRVFTGPSDGLCVEFKREPFERHFKSNPNLRARPVRYLNLGDADRLGTEARDHLPFYKRKGFEPEEEYRVVVVSDKPQQAALGVPIEMSFINKIVINPWLPDTLCESLRATLRSIDQCSRIRIDRSHLIDSLRWKNAGNKVVGRPEMGRLVLDVDGKRAAKKPTRRTQDARRK
jgi:hypothetical protein